jgi:hypothetical protein
MAADLEISQWISDDGTIRIGPGGQPSIFDMIKVLGGSSNPRRDWARIAESHPEVVPKVYNLLFPGPGQRETPVAKDRESAYYILGLLPGAAGRKYREHAAKLFTRFLEDPAGLAASIADTLTEDQAAKLEARLAGKRTRRTFTDELKEYGVVQQGYAHCTNAIYVPILNADAWQLKERFAEEKGLPVKKVNPRDHMSIQQLNDVDTAERVAVGQLRRSTVAGNVGVARVVRKSAEFTRKLLDGDIDIPGMTV